MSLDIVVSGQQGAIRSRGVPPRRTSRPPRPGRLDVRSVGEGDALVVAGELDIHTVPVLQAALERASHHSGDVRLDLADLSFCDSSGARVLLRFAHRLGADRRLVLLSVQPGVAETLGALEGMGGSASPHGHDALVHEALVYEEDEEFLLRVVPFVTDGLAHGDPVVVVTSPPNLALLNEALGPSAEDVRFVDSSEWYRHPVRTIAAYAEILAGFPDAARPRVVGQVDFETMPWAHRAWTGYEAVLNEVFASRRAHILCPYDARRLPREVVEDAERTHPSVSRGKETFLSAAYEDPTEVVRRLALVPPIDEVLERFELGDEEALGFARMRVEEVVRGAGLTPEQVEAAVLAANEVLTNVLAHGGGLAEATIGRSEEVLVCEVADAGSRPPDLLTGYLPPGSASDSGWGLWLSRCLSDGLAIATSEEGTVVRMAWDLGP